MNILHKWLLPILGIIFLVLTSRPMGTSSANPEMYAEVNSILSGTLYLNQYSKFLGYDQSYKDGNWFSSHGPGISILNIPSAIIIGKPIEFLLNGFTKDRKKIFLIAGNFTYITTNIILYLLAIIMVNKAFPELSLMGFNLFFFSANFIYLNQTLKEGVITSLLLIIIALLRIDLYQDKKKILFFIPLIILCLTREIFLCLYPLLFFYFLYEKNKQFAFLTLLFFIINVSIMSWLNFIVTESLSPLLTARHYDPNGPFRDPPARIEDSLSSKFYLRLNLDIIFSLKFGIFGFYYFTLAAFLMPFSKIFSKKFDTFVLFLIFIFLILHYSIIKFSYTSEIHPGNRPSTPFFAILFLYLLIYSEHIRHKLIAHLLFLLELIKNLTLIFVGLRYDYRWFARTIPEIDTQYKFIFENFKYFGCNIFEHINTTQCYKNIIDPHFTIIDFSLICIYIFIITYLVKMIFYENKLLNPQNF